MPLKSSSKLFPSCFLFRSYWLEVPVLCLANKQDKPEAMSIEELSRSFEFERLFSGRAFHVHPCCALKGQGLEAAVRWLLAESHKQRK